MALPKPHRSGGPRTAAGRQAIAHNALRTGAYAAQVVLPGEDPAHFDELVQQFQHDFAPTDVAESALVHQLAVITWKKLRLDRIEHSHYLSFIQREYTRLELESVTHLLPPGDPLGWVNAQRLYTRQERDAWATALQLAHELSTAPSSGYPPSTLKHIQSTAPQLWWHIELEAQEYDDPIPQAEWLTTSVTTNEWDGLFLAGCARGFIQSHDPLGWLLHRRSDAENALRLLQEKRLLTAINLGNVGRHHDDLDRAFQRTLAELRRQQNWRRDRATLTVVPTPESVSAHDTPAP